MIFKSTVPTRRRIVRLLVQALIFLMVYMGARAWMQRDMVTGVAPPISATDLAGQTVSLQEYAGEPFLLHFWASWCSICEFEQGAISSVAQTWPVLSVAMQSGDSGEVAEYMQERQLRWRTVVDDSGGLAQRYGVQGVPASFVIDAKGNIRFKETGLTTSWGLRLRLWFSRVMS